VGELLRTTSTTLCPGELEPRHPAHQLQVSTLNAFHGAAEKDADGEIVPAAANAYNAAAYPAGGAMRLYREKASTVADGRPIAVEALYFRCRICGLVLPAGRVPDRLSW
jgi:hypothetical protein